MCKRCGTVLDAFTVSFRDFPFSLIILWHADPLLGGDRETGDCTVAVARQRSAINKGIVLSALSDKQQLVDLEETEVRNKCAGEVQQQFNRLTDQPTDRCKAIRIVGGWCEMAASL
jgi:hypothetical protein